MDNAALFQVRELNIIVPALEQYELALRGAPHRGTPAFVEQAKADEEIQKTQRLLKLCRFHLKDARSEDEVKRLHPITAADNDFLKAIFLIDEEANRRELKQRLEALMQRKAELPNREELRKIDAERDQFKEKLDECRSREEIAADAQKQGLLLSPAMILDVADPERWDTA